jgi:hypothetical protein
MSAGGSIRATRRVRAISGAVALALVLAVPRAHANAGVATGGPTYLAWSACSGDPLAQGSVQFDCDAEGGAVYTLVGSFAVTEPLSRVVSMSADVIITFPTLVEIPAFWNTRIGGCNDSALLLSKNLSAGCDADPNAFCSGDSSQCDALYATTVGAGGNSLTLNITLTRYPFGSVSLDAAPQRYYAFAVSVPMSNASHCSGCPSSAFALWTNATIYAVDEDDQPLPPILIGSSFPGSLSCANINGGTAIGCESTAVFRSTWGRLKAMYR